MADEPNSLDDSEIVIAKILSLLMEWGIQNCELQFSKLDLDERYGTYFFPCIEWLVEEGIVRTGEVQQTLDSNYSGWVMNPVLTSYGFRVLGLKVTVGDSEETLSTAVRNVSKDQRSYSHFGDFFGGLLGGFTKSLGS